MSAGNHPNMIEIMLNGIYLEESTQTKSNNIIQKSCHIVVLCNGRFLSLILTLTP